MPPLAALPQRLCRGQPRACVTCSCCCCSRCLHHGVGRPEIWHYDFPSRVPPGSPAPTVVPGAASEVHDILLLLLLLLLLCLRCVFAANPRQHDNYASQPLSVMCFRILKLKRGSSCLGSCTSAVMDIVLASRRASRADLVLVWYVSVRFIPVAEFTPTSSPALCTVD